MLEKLSLGTIGQFIQWTSTRYQQQIREKSMRKSLIRRSEKHGCKSKMNLSSGDMKKKSSWILLLKIEHRESDPETLFQKQTSEKQMLIWKVWSEYQQTLSTLIQTDFWEETAAQELFDTHICILVESLDRQRCLNTQFPHSHISLELITTHMEMWDIWLWLLLST